MTGQRFADAFGMTNAGMDPAFRNFIPSKVPS
jgi:hypothetical protein